MLLYFLLLIVSGIISKKFKVKYVIIAYRLVVGKVGYIPNEESAKTVRKENMRALQMNKKTVPVNAG